MLVCKNQYLDSVLVALALQTVPEGSYPEQEGESTKIAGKLPECVCPGLEWCECPGIGPGLAPS